MTANKKIIPRVYLGLFISLELFTDKVYAENKVDMGDPTAVYSSIGTEINSNNELDFSIGISSGAHLGLLESKDGATGLKLTYAHMEEGQGFYAEAGGDSDVNNVSAGYVMTLPLTDYIKFYPVSMIGFTNDKNRNDYDTVMTVGGYTRITLGQGFQLGLDPFYTAQFSDDGYVDTMNADAFVGYQYETHRFRFGVTSEYDGQVFLNYKLAF